MNQANGTVDHLKSFLDAIVGDRNPHTAPARHGDIPILIADRWRGWGLPAELDEFTADGTVGRNVFVAPQHSEEPFVLAMAHHDTVPHCPGADDNGSGMAVVDVLASIRAEGAPWNIALALTDFEEGHPARWREDEAGHADESVAEALMRFVETYGTPPLGFLGARRLRDRIRSDGLLDLVEVVLNYETVGYTAPDQQIPEGVAVGGPLPGDFVAIVGNQRGSGWVQRLAGAAQVATFPLVVPGRGHEIPDTRRSDHAVFWDEDIAAVMLTDTAELRNPHYHQPTDTEVDLPFLAGVVDMAGGALTAWAAGQDRSGQPW